MEGYELSRGDLGPAAQPQRGGKLGRRGGFHMAVKTMMVPTEHAAVRPGGPSMPLSEEDVANSGRCWVRWKREDEAQRGHPGPAAPQRKRWWKRMDRDEVEGGGWRGDDRPAPRRSRPSCSALARRKRGAAEEHDGAEDDDERAEPAAVRPGTAAQRREDQFWALLGPVDGKELALWREMAESVHEQSL